MNRFSRLAPACVLASAALAACASTSEQPAIRSAGNQPVEVSAASQQDVPLPSGWTQDDMQACMLAGMPGEMHAHLAKGSGAWEGKFTMWMAPGVEPMTSSCKSSQEMVMDGRYAKSEFACEMPGMGPFTGFALYGFDNVSKKFASAWIDSMSTGLMHGTGELSADGKTLTWNHTYNCPVAQKPAVMRQIEKITGENTKTLDMFGKDPKTGVEFQMMHIELTRRSN